jgi:hypothetical protein
MMMMHLTHINPEQIQSVQMIDCVQGIKIHLADACLLGDVRDCFASADSRFSLIVFVKEF